MLRYLLALALAFAPCGQTEIEPNGSPYSATRTGTIPAVERLSVCGESYPGDFDYWKIHLDYHTNWFCEGAARFLLHTEQAPALLQLQLYQKDWAGGWRYIGNWYSINGTIYTGEVGLEYWDPKITDVYAVVNAPVGSCKYGLTFW